MVHLFSLAVSRFRQVQHGFQPFELSETWLDYNNATHCTHFIRHAYLIDQSIIDNYWHSFMDLLLPVYSLVRDPCFYPPPIDLSDNHLERSEGVSQPADLGDTLFPPESVLILGEADIGAKRFGLARFVLDDLEVDSFPRKRGQTIPAAWTRSAAAQSGTLCIQDLIVGIPWFFHGVQYPTDRPDPDRMEWEIHRMNEFVYRRRAKNSARQAEQELITPEPNES